MKKKFLSLMMAAAVVATTSVSAFAQDKLIDGLDTQEHTTDVTITGKVLDQNDREPAGNFNITVPTSAAFTVGKDQKVISASIVIRNNGDQDVDVFAESFTDTTPNADDKITVVREGDLANKNRTNVSLSIGGSLKTLYLGSDPGAGSKKGLYENKSLGTPASEFKLVKIQGRQEGTLTLAGEAGKQDGDTGVTNAVSDKFTLVLKIKKSEK